MSISRLVKVVGTGAGEAGDHGSSHAPPSASRDQIMESGHGLVPQAFVAVVRRPHNNHDLSPRRRLGIPSSQLPCSPAHNLLVNLRELTTNSDLTISRNSGQALAESFRRLESHKRLR